MAINPVEKINSTMATAPVQKTPAGGNNLESEIAAKQQRLKRVSSDEDMTASEKEQKRREIQKEIDELNRKLKEEEAKKKEAITKEAQKEAREEALQKETFEKENFKEEKLQKELKAESAEKTQNSDVSKEIEKHIDMPVKDIQQMLSADYLVQKEQVQKQIDIEIQNKIQVLKSEIDQDKLYGSDTTKKEAELKTLQEKENFWTKTSTEAIKKQQETDSQTQAQVQTRINNNAKVVIDQI